MQLTVGQMWASTLDTTTVIVVRAGQGGELTCGGAAMVDAKLVSKRDDQTSPARAPGTDATGTQLGKRYVNADETIEVLCTKPGQHALAVDGTPLTAKVAKPLPSSD